MAKPETLFSKVFTIPRDEHMDFRIEVQVRNDNGKRSGVLVAGKARDGERVLDVYVKDLSPKQMMELSLALREAAQTVAAGGA